MQYCRPSVAGQNADVLVMKFGPPVSTFKMNSGDTSYIWQLGNQTNIVADRGTGVATTQFCKVSVIANKNGIVTQLNTEDANTRVSVLHSIGSPRAV
jgi:hypothetical protein